ncbi:hypothetical protein [Roseivirga thermotolerans]|uniref:hypothetical protein n=1 Tax=Roseivirga thermotolerans TaxID=1758176 RepID=UPI00273D38E5|nr:hypothetical protein [Roseivirga thermotolerans]
MKPIETFGYKKTIPEEIYFPALKTLSFYPELKNVRIIFRFNKPNGRTVMSARPVIKSLFGVLVERAYYVNISRFIKLGSESLKIEDLPEDVLIGWLGHELGHVMDYKDRSVPGMIWFRLNYWLSGHFVKGAERKADEYAVQHGLGDMIVKTKNYILSHAQIPRKYKEKMKRLYLSPEEIMQMVETNQHNNAQPAL